jgi:hypothetical protein
MVGSISNVHALSLAAAILRQRAYYVVALSVLTFAVRRA